MGGGTEQMLSERTDHEWTKYLKELRTPLAVEPFRQMVYSVHARTWYVDLFVYHFGGA